MRWCGPKVRTPNARPRFYGAAPRSPTLLHGPRRPLPACERNLWYRLDLRNGAGDLVRALDVTDAEWLYAAAQETADFGAPQTVLRLRVAQYGDEWGLGPWTERVVAVRPG